MKESFLLLVIDDAADYLHCGNVAHRHCQGVQLVDLLISFNDGGLIERPQHLVGFDHVHHHLLLVGVEIAVGDTDEISNRYCGLKELRVGELGPFTLQATGNLADLLLQVL